MIRKDNPDVIYKNEDIKFKAVIEDIKESYKKGQPVLVGTVSISKSEKLSSMLNKEGIPHVVLNAKYHEKEAEIVAQAGKLGAVTIATNMAGRGTDIMLGGNSEYLAKQEMKKLNYSSEAIEQATAFNETDDQDILAAREKFRELEAKFEEEIKEEKEKVIAAGGLKIIGTERHESRRIDNQLRGRSGRQGDPGESKFYIALNDDLMKIFGGNAITKVYDTLLGENESMPVEAKIISKAVESAQSKVEDRNFSIRKNVLQYDDVMNTQREIIYGQRRDVLDGENLKDSILKMIDSSIESLVHSYTADLENVNREALLQDINISLGIEDVENVNKDQINRDELISELKDKAVNIYEAKEAEFGSEDLRELERVVMLKVVDQKWMDHIDNMDELKNGIGLRAYGQKDPVVQYRIEGFEMFDEMVEDIKNEVTKIMLHIQKKETGTTRSNTAEITDASLEDTAINLVDGNLSEKEGGMNKTVVNKEPKVGRNDLCPCGSGKKYKNCCGKNA
jgi:preprotein translocase subunit SecA